MDNREFQQQARFKINRLLNNRRNPVFISPCGTGKTFTSCMIIKDRIKLNRRVFILVPQIEIFEQWIEELVKHGLNPGLINDGGIKGNNRMVYVCMTLSLVNLLHYIPENIYPDEIITDEMQHSLANSWKEIYTFFKNSSRLGLTATLHHGSSMTFKELYTDIVQTITKKEAIKKKYITEPLLIAPLKFEKKIPIKNDDYDLNVQAAELGKVEIIGNVIDFYNDTFAGLPVIVPCATFEHAAYMTKMFNNNGWEFRHLHSNLNKHDRKKILNQIANAKINGICTVGIGIEGLSIKGLYGVLWLRRTLSPIIWTQFNGRAERTLPGKKYYICADFVGNSVIHGLPDKNYTWSLEGKLEEPEKEITKSNTKECPNCGVINYIDNEICHFCNTNFEEMEFIKGNKRGFPSMVDGELVLVNSQEIKNNIELNNLKIKEKQKEQTKKEDPIEMKDLNNKEKVNILRDNLFKNPHRRELFIDAVKNYL